MVKENDKKMGNKTEGKKKYDGFAIASFVFGILNITIPLFLYLLAGLSKAFASLFLISFFLWPLLCTPLSFIFGIISLNRIRINDKLKGRVFAWIGFIISSLIIMYILFEVIQYYGTGILGFP